MFIRFRQPNDEPVTVQASEIAAFRKCAIDAETELFMKGAPGPRGTFEVRETEDEVAWLVVQALGSQAACIWSIEDKVAHEARNANR